MSGYYIDLLPFPNEAGAIPTSNVTREDAARLCESKGKRLCTELEWERACKGADNRAYEYGDQYRPEPCGTGISAEQAAKRPSGERIGCKSGFGTLDMHGGVWEWTDSAWKRGASSAPDLNVLKGGNAVAGELVGRCANAIGRPKTTKSATMGLRCCAGTRNSAEVDFEPRNGAPLERSAKPAELAAPLAPVAAKAWGDAGSVTFGRAWTWRPVGNEELVVGAGCANAAVPAARRCGVMVARVLDGGAEPVAQFEAGHDVPEVAQFGEARKLRARATDARGGFTREITYGYGRVEIGEAKR
jgi:hypothetical protein